MNTYEQFHTPTLHQLNTYVNTQTYDLRQTYAEPHTYSRIQAMTGFGEYLKERRLKAGLSQEELADRLGMKRTNYVPFETGELPGPKILQRMADLKELNLDFDEALVRINLDRMTPRQRIKMLEGLQEDLTIARSVLGRKDKRKDI